MSHLSEQELLDAVEQTLTAREPRAHLASCPQCRLQVDDLTATIDAARLVDVPEPSPLFWEALSRRVREATQAEPGPRRVEWHRWPVLVPLGGLTLLVLALTAAIAPRQADPGPSGAGPLAPVVEPENEVASNEIGPTNDAAWALMADLVASLDPDVALEAGSVTVRGAAEQALLHLTAAEQEELVRLLRDELQRPGGG